MLMPASGGRAGAGRDDQVGEVAPLAGGDELVDGDGVVAHDLGGRAELAGVLHEVVDERVVVVDEQDLGLTGR